MVVWTAAREAGAAAWAVFDDPLRAGIGVAFPAGRGAAGCAGFAAAAA
jgi:hypothetical protein